MAGVGGTAAEGLREAPQLCLRTGSPQPLWSAGPGVPVSLGGSTKGAKDAASLQNRGD